MPQSYTINPNQNRIIDAPVDTLSVGVGEAIVTFPAPGKLPDDESQTDAPKQESQTFTLTPDSDPLECKGQGNISVFSAEGASVSVIYEDEVTSPGGLSGGRSRVPGEQDTVSPEATAGHEKGVPAGAGIGAPGGQPASSTRGDSDKSDKSGEGGSGPFESRTVKELRQVAKDRGLTGTSKLSKDALIERLRNE
ncbi:MAG TPA: Rho termination factor N-terminal domain-containing protein [Solirubrobacterales bacterium]